MTRDFPARIVEYLRAIRHDRYDKIELDSLPPEEQSVVAEINKIFAERDRILREEQARYRLIINATPIAICITNEFGYYEFANPEYRRLTGYAEDELIGEHFSLVVPERYRETLTRLHDEFMGQRAELDGQWTIVRKDGHELTILANAAYIVDVDAKPKKVTYVIDISEIVESRQQLEEEIEKRKITEQIRDQVERVMRHDLRNPLDGIQTAATFLLQDEENERRKEFIELMLDATEQARDQIENSLAYARMQRGQYHLQYSRINLVQMIRVLVSRLSGVIEGHNVELEMRYNSAPWPQAYDVELWGEQRFLSDAIANLLRNAIEASLPGESVGLSVYDRDVILDGTPAVAIEISNASDVPPEIRDRLFDPYVTLGKSHGTGLGAYTADLVIRAHNGTIELTTGDGGTIIRVIVPRARLERERSR